MFSLLDSYIYGFVLPESSRPFDSAEEAPKIAGLVLGSTTHKVIHLTDRPVLVIR